MAAMRRASASTAGANGRSSLGPVRAFRAVGFFDVRLDPSDISTLHLSTVDRHAEVPVPAPLEDVVRTGDVIERPAGRFEQTTNFCKPDI
jgi:hypothetical protein